MAKDWQHFLYNNNNKTKTKQSNKNKVLATYFQQSTGILSYNMKARERNKTSELEGKYNDLYLHIMQYYIRKTLNITQKFIRTNN